MHEVRIPSRQLMDCRRPDGGPSKLGAGRIEGGGVAVLQQATELELSQDEALRWLALFREVINAGTAVS